jgi:hypothetical protein
MVNGWAICVTLQSQPIFYHGLRGFHGLNLLAGPNWTGETPLLPGTDWTFTLPIGWPKRRKLSLPSAAAEDKNFSGMIFARA